MSDLLTAAKEALAILRSDGVPGWGAAKDILGEAIAKAEQPETSKPVWKDMAGQSSRIAARNAALVTGLMETGRALLDKLPAHWHDDATVEFRDAVEQAERTFAAEEPTHDQS